MDTTIEIPGYPGVAWDTERFSDIRPRGDGTTPCCCFDYYLEDGSVIFTKADISAEQLKSLIDAARRTVVGFAALPRVRAD